MANCEAILAGLYNTSLSSSEIDMASSFRNWFRSKNFRSFSQAQDTGFGVGIPLGDILVKLGIDNSSQSFTSFLQELESEETFNSKYKAVFHTELKQVNDVVVKAWENCIQIDSKGTKIWFVHNAGEDSFTLWMKYVSGNPSNFDRLERVRFTNNVIIDDDGPFVKRNGKTIKEKLSQSGDFQQFRRRDIRKPLTITVQTLEERKSFTLNALLPPPKLRIVKATFKAKGTNTIGNSLIIRDDAIFRKISNHDAVSISDKVFYFNSTVPGPFECEIHSTQDSVKLELQTTPALNSVDMTLQAGGETWLWEIRNYAEGIPQSCPLTKPA